MLRKIWGISYELKYSYLKCAARFLKIDLVHFIVYKNFKGTKKVIIKKYLQNLLTRKKKWNENNLENSLWVCMLSVCVCVCEDIVMTKIK